MTALRIAQAEEMVDHRLDVLAARDNRILLSSRRRIVDSCFIAIVLIAGTWPQRYMLDLIAGKRAPEKGKPEELLLADIGIDVAAATSIFRIGVVDDRVRDVDIDATQRIDRLALRLGRCPRCARFLRARG